MKRFNLKTKMLTGMIFAALATSAMATDNAPPSTLTGSGLNICATNSAWAVGAKTATYGQTIANYTLWGPAGNTQTTLNVLAEASGTGKSSIGTMARYAETNVGNTGGAYIASKGSMGAWANGNEAGQVGGDMLSTNKSGTTVQFMNGHGFMAQGTGLIEGASSGTFVMRWGSAAVTPPPVVAPTVNCDANGCK